MNIQKTFLEQYHTCIDETGNPKACGRENTKKLIFSASQIDGKCYGDLETGFMDVNKLVQLYMSVRNNECPVSAS